MTDLRRSSLMPLHTHPIVDDVYRRLKGNIPNFWHWVQPHDDGEEVTSLELVFSIPEDKLTAFDLLNCATMYDISLEAEDLCVLTIHLDEPKD